MTSKYNALKGEKNNFPNGIIFIAGNIVHDYEYMFCIRRQLQCDYALETSTLREHRQFACIQLVEALDSKWRFL
jgi:hypothetical protein